MRFLLLSMLLLLATNGLSATPDDNVEWAGVSHIAWQDRRPLVPMGGEAFEVRFQVYRNDITSAQVHVDDGSPLQVAAAWVTARGPYDVWSATVPATLSGSLSYFIAITDGSDTDYYSVSGMSETMPTDGGFVLDDSTLVHAPMGATLATSGTVFKVWAPTRSSAHVRGSFNAWGLGNPMTKVGEYFIVHVANAGDLQQYKYYFNNSRWNTDARARRLGALPDINAYIENPFRYVWQTSDFETPQLEEMVIYQLHVGTFSGLNDPFGSAPFPARYIDVQNRVAHLADLGVNAVMLNPITEFPGDNSAGYNPQTQWAPESRYGNPDALKAMIDVLHQNGIAVLVDVVWNHFTINDNFMWNYDGTQLYFDSPAVDTPWGAQADFDARGVREYFLDSALYWFEELHVDGFRMDATDFMGVAPQEAAGWSLMQALNDCVDNRWVDKVMIAEELPDDPNVTKPTSLGGAGFDSQYHDAFTDRLREEILDAAFGDPEMWKIRNIVNGSGTYLNGRNVVNYLELHDEAWPTSGGQRMVKTIDTTAPHDDVWARGRIKLAQGLVLTSPGVPAILQGAEWLEDADFGTDPQNRIDWAHKTTYAEIHQFFKDLIALRTGNPALRADSPHTTHHLNEGGNVIGFRRYDNNGNDLVVIANFSNGDYPGYRIGVPLAGEWSEILNSQALEYGGSGLDNPGTLVTETIFADGYPQSLVLELPRMGLLILRPGTAATAVADDFENLGGLVRFENVHPTPVREQAALVFHLSASRHVRLTIHDVRGRWITTLIDARQPEGRHVLRWTGLDHKGNPVPAGTYFARLQFEGQSLTRKIAFLR